MWSHILGHLVYTRWEELNATFSRFQDYCDDWHTNETTHDVGYLLIFSL